MLRLYVAGASRKSSKAIANTRRLCEEHLAGKYELEIIDIYNSPRIAIQRQIVAVPTLVRERPGPVRKFIGDMSETSNFLAAVR